MVVHPDPEVPPLHNDRAFSSFFYEGVFFFFFGPFHPDGSSSFTDPEFFLQCGADIFFSLHLLRLYLLFFP